MYFRYFEIQKYRIFFISSDKTWSSEKNDYMIWFVSFDSTIISWHKSFTNFVKICASYLRRV